MEILELDAPLPEAAARTRAMMNAEDAGATSAPDDSDASLPEPGRPVDSCRQDSDCAIKNVGNCCGFYPRCINAESEPPPVVCPPGVSSVCGWAEITHCTCVENTCRSMQGDHEV